MDGMVGLAPSIMYQAAQQTAGDFDVSIIGNKMSFKSELANTNFYTDEFEFFQSKHLTKQE